MKKEPGPGFRKKQIELEPCPICKGKAVMKGVFYELACADCNGSGWVIAGSKLVVSTDELVTQLSFKLQQAQREIAALKSQMVGRQSQYEKLNRLGAGGTNYTGD
ncbi:hypothetical protein [Pseudomonas sp. Irchel s3b2]|uniref:hypothetical protein n=1 Tax=Pseudomonas sp. Irchel s3b2 TaxID=2009073 RepID=UPI000BA370FB|nr:hypothetical protein [Pseudomonas sp. Irchel s3b2]